MPSYKHNSITAKAMGLIFSLLNVASAGEVSWHTTVCTMELPVFSFLFHSSLLIAKGVDLVVARDGFLCIVELSIFFIATTLFTEMLLEQFLICTAWVTYTVYR